MKYYHEKILPVKFTLQGQSMYADVFRNKKKNNAPLLVETGEFRDRTLYHPEIRATANKASIKYLLGTPSNSEARAKAGSFYAESQKPIRAMD